MRKKLLSFLFVGVMIGTLITGCGNQTEVAESKEKQGKEEVTIWYYWENKQHQEILAKELEKFNSSQEEVVAQAKYVPFADFKKQLSIGATSSELPDIAILDGPDHASYSAMGIFADITDQVEKADFYEGPLESCTFEDKVYGIPFGSNCLALYYNEDMLKEAGVTPPTTWDELKETAKKLTNGKVSGLAFCSLQNEEGTFNFSPWLWSTGTDSFHLDNPQGIKALTFVRDLVKEGAMNKEVINWTQGDVMNQFISGNVAMMINGPWQVPTMRELAPDLNWNVTLIPKDKEYASVLGGENLAVIENEKKEASIQVAKFLTSKEEVESYIDTFGYISARKDVAKNQFAGDEQMKKFIEQMEYAKPRGPHANWPEISDAISLAFNEAITETLSPEDAAAKAQKTIDSIVK